MAVKFKTIAKTEPGVTGGGTKKFYAQIVFDGEVTIDNLVKSIEKFSALSEPDIRGVIIALENEIQNQLSESKIVRLERLGSFYPAISSEGKLKEEEVLSDCIKKLSVNYRPGERIQKAINDAKLEKVK